MKSSNSDVPRTDGEKQDAEEATRRGEEPEMRLKETASTCLTPAVFPGCLSRGPWPGAVLSARVGDGGWSPPQFSG